MPRHRAERVGVGHGGERTPCGRVARSALGHRRQRLRVGQRDQRVDGRQTLRLAEALEYLERDVAQHRQRVRADAVVGIVPGDAGQRRRGHQFSHRRTPHARIRIAARNLGEQIPLVERKLLDEGEADGGVGVFVAGLRAESIQQCHTRSSLTCSARASL